MHSNKRLNPFLCPSETDVKYLAFGICTYTLAAYLFSQIPLLVLGWAPAFFLDPAHSWFLKTEVGPDLAILGCALIFLVSVLQAIVEPLIVQSRLKLEKLPEKLEERLAGILESLSNSEKFAKAARFKITCACNFLEPVAMKILHNQVVILPFSLLVPKRKSQSMPMALIAHELSHFVNGDLEKTQLLIATWRSFVAVCLIPYCFLLAPTCFFVPKELVFDILPILILSGSLLLLFKSAIRSREMYADVRATIMCPVGNIQDVLKSGKEKAYLVSLLADHPAPQFRQNAVENPALLLAPTAIDAISIGILLGTSLVSCSNVISLNSLSMAMELNPNTINLFLYGLITGCFIANLAIKSAISDVLDKFDWKKLCFLPLFYASYFAGTFLSPLSSASKSSLAVDRLFAFAELFAAGIMVYAIVYSIGRMLVCWSKARWLFALSSTAIVLGLAMQYVFLTSLPALTLETTILAGLDRQDILSVIQPIKGSNGHELLTTLLLPTILLLGLTLSVCKKCSKEDEYAL